MPLRTLNVIAKNLAVTLGAALAETLQVTAELARSPNAKTAEGMPRLAKNCAYLATLSTARHVWVCV